MLNHLQDYQGDSLDFNELTLIDKVMMCKLLSFSAKVTEAYDSIDLAKVYEITQRFVEETSKFYLEFSRERIYHSAKDSVPYRSSIQVYANLLKAIVQAAAPVLMYTAQEAHTYMPASMFDKKPITVFQ